jgi:hypothetical protein
VWKVGGPDACLEWGHWLNVTQSVYDSMHHNNLINGYLVSRIHICTAQAERPFRHV